MSSDSKKPTPILPERSKICPVCSQRSYSRDGIHPQCSMVLADRPQKMRLAAIRKAEQARD